MAFKFKDKHFDLRYIDYEGEKVHVSELEDKSVTIKMKQNMRMNSYAQDKLPPKLDTEALLYTAKYYLEQCSRRNYPCSTYDEAIVHILLPELIKRLEERGESV